MDVYFNNITDLKNATIIVKDSGIGMTEEILEHVWLEPGTAFRKPVNDQRERSVVRTPIFNRVPMGEKGVGRFAVHKLGNVIKLISRPPESPLFKHKNCCEKPLKYGMKLKKSLIFIKSSFDEIIKNCLFNRLYVDF